MRIGNIALTILAAGGLGFAGYVVRTQNQPVAPAQPVADPAHSPFEERVSGAGIIEASTRNIAIGTNIAGVVTRVHVEVNDRVKAGDPLFQVDDRSLRAQLGVREAALASADADLQRLEAMPRIAEIPPLEARVAEMEALSSEMKDRLARVEALVASNAASVDDLTVRRFAYLAAEARLAQARADLTLKKDGAWEPDLAAARARAEAARAEVESVKTEIERLTVRAPVGGTILQVNIRVGEYAPAMTMSTPFMVMGDTGTLHVRADIDEYDAWRVRPDSPAVAALRGNSTLRTNLKFVRIEPYVIPKRSLTGDSSERVDTRVLQVIYEFPAGALPAYVGQQVDVFIGASPREDQAPAPARTEAARG